MAVTVVREKLLAEFGSGRGRSVQARLVEYAGIGVRFDIRQFFVDDHGQTLPTSKGCGIKPEHIAELRKALDAFESEVSLNAPR
jgi:hypothetical protein